MQSYWASVVKIPKVVTKEIDGILKKFLWSYSGMSNGKAKVAWNMVCKPKCEGGLGIRNLEEWNDVLLIVSKKESLWVKWVNLVKLKNKSFWDVQEEKSDSCTWRALLDLRNKVRPSYCGQWEDIVVADMIENGKWKWPVEWIINFQFLKYIPVLIIKENVADKVKWRCNDGKLVYFSTKNAWWDLSVHQRKVPWWKVVWFPRCNPRSAFIMWLAANERLSTQDRIMKWSPSILLCPLCNKMNDSHDHLFFKCDFSKSIWDKLKNKMNMNNIPNDWRGLIDKAAECPCNNAIRSVLRRIILATTVYYIWKERNSRIFTNDKIQAMRYQAAITKFESQEVSASRKGG
ncbi:RNA-directed DNA polymerase, eukaryota, reverse transcriptase zinc-binding domain protein [Tanacetum coccineum]|uniref:RNA-directed DNA polymerase, eukaryota, reverse transcriptase zinc-binding domain protein n=1 Tax=Tanacetum coccineum TaxID=301880 RepID=A0ABQ4YZJ2_9ASTR